MALLRHESCQVPGGIGFFILESETQTHEPRKGIDWNAVAHSPGFIPGVIAAAGVFILFSGLLVSLPSMWIGDDYYSHGFLVPFLTGYVVYRAWPTLQGIPVKPGYVAAVFFPIVLWCYRTSMVSDLRQLASVCFLIALLLAVWFAAGLRWMGRLALPILFLGFMLPLRSGAIDVYTNPLQLLSTKVAYHLLSILGQDPLMVDNTNIMIGNYALNVAVPCSGLKLLIAVSAFTIFFLMIAKLKPAGNLAMVLFVVPLCLFINGLRIALIGMVGAKWGEDAARGFHDYSGYITLVICFLLLDRVARWLGWKG
jgi:exosortase